jgi:hypothetical protein
MLNLLSSEKPLAIESTKNGINISATAVVNNIEATRKDKASDAKTSAICLLEIRFESIGINAVLKAPSANSRRNMFGKENAIMKASATGPDPKKLAINISLTNPSILLASVHAPTIEKLRINLNCNKPPFSVIS